MSEKVVVRQREPEPGGFANYMEVVAGRETFVNRQNSMPLVIKAPRPEQYELGPQGLLGWYLMPDGPTCLQDWWVFIHDIRGVSGRHRHQGGLVLFIVEGKGYSILNGVRYDWEEGDVILMPLLPEGIEHQHFNLREDGSSKWLAFIHRPTFDEMGSELVQSALDPEFVERTGVTTWKGATVAKEELSHSKETSEESKSK